MQKVSTQLEDLTEEQQAMLISFMQKNFVPTKGINSRHSAYGLKQRFSRKHFYLTQEQFAQAMSKAGFQAQLLNGGNAYFNISERSPYFKNA